MRQLWVPCKLKRSARARAAIEVATDADKDRESGVCCQGGLARWGGFMGVFWGVEEVNKVRME
jgi:hypothetical protein